MSREDVIRRIMDRDRRNLGLAEGVVRREDTVLYASACECFATWDTALRYAGVSKQRVTRQREAGAETVKRQILDLCQRI